MDAIGTITASRSFANAIEFDAPRAPRPERGHETC